MINHFLVDVGYVIWPLARYVSLLWINLSNHEPWKYSYLGESHLLQLDQSLFYGRHCKNCIDTLCSDVSWLERRVTRLTTMTSWSSWWSSWSSGRIGMTLCFDLHSHATFGQKSLATLLIVFVLALFLSFLYQWRNQSFPFPTFFWASWGRSSIPNDGWRHCNPIS